MRSAQRCAESFAIKDIANLTAFSSEVSPFSRKASGMSRT
jgi:hypothetical protein